MVFSALSHILIQVLEKQLDDPSGNRLDAYDIESSHERSDVLRDLQEFVKGIP